MGGMKLSISLPDALVARVDEMRGDVPRSLWIRRRLEERIGFGVGDAEHGTAFIGGAAPIQEPPTPELERSPTPSREDKPRKPGGSVAAQPRPIVQKRSK